MRQMKIFSLSIFVIDFLAKNCLPVLTYRNGSPHFRIVRTRVIKENMCRSTEISSNASKACKYVQQCLLRHPVEEELALFRTICWCTLWMHYNCVWSIVFFWIITIALHLKSMFVCWLISSLYVFFHTVWLEVYLPFSKIKWFNWHLLLHFARGLTKRKQVASIILLWLPFDIR